MFPSEAQRSSMKFARTLERLCFSIVKNCSPGSEGGNKLEQIAIHVRADV